MAKSAWDVAQEAAEKAAGGTFFKLKGGERVKVIFVGAPQAVEKEFTNDNGKVEKSTRIAINLVNVETADNVQIWEMSPTSFKALNEVVSIKGQKATYFVKRTGSGMQDTVYSFIHDKDLSAEQLEKLSKLELHSFDGSDSGPEPDADEDVPF